MKHLIWAFGLALAACGSAKHDPEVKTGIPKIPAIIGSKISKQIISADKSDTSEAIVAYQFYSVPKLPYQDSVNYGIGEFAWDFTTIGEDRFTYRPLTHAFFQERIDNFAQGYLETEKESDFSPIWGCELESAIDESLEGYVQIRQSAYVYTGGAHPNSYVYFSVISKEDGSRLFLEDLVTDVEKFNRIAEKYFRKSREIGPDESLETDYWFENGIYASNNNFLITDQGIEFYFNPYEIAAYVYGPTEFTVPMKEIKDLLKVKL